MFNTVILFLLVQFYLSVEPLPGDIDLRAGTLLAFLHTSPRVQVSSQSGLDNDMFNPHLKLNIIEEKYARFYLSNIELY